MNLAANISLMFREWPLLDRFQAARDAGFAAVEIQSPYEETTADLARARDAADVAVILINAPVIADAHPAGFACRPELRAEFRAALPRIAEYAEALGVPMVNILSGHCRVAEERATCRATLIENLSLAADSLPGLQVLLEPLNSHDVPGFFMVALDEAEPVLAACGGKVGLQFDLYHLTRMGQDPLAALERMLPRVRHVQFSDSPGRHEPGTGTIRFFETLDRLEASGYTGWVSAEYRPATTTLAGLGWLEAWRARYGATVGAR